MNADDLGLDRTGTGTCAVSGHMRMSVDQARTAMGSPAGMADAAGARQISSIAGLLIKMFQLAYCLHDLGRLFAVADGKSRGIIAAVFQFRQAFQQDRRRRLTAGISYIQLFRT